MEHLNTLSRKLVSENVLVFFTQKESKSILKLERDVEAFGFIPVYIGYLCESGPYSNITV